MGKRKREHRDAVIAGRELPVIHENSYSQRFWQCGHCQNIIPHGRFHDHLVTCQGPAAAERWLDQQQPKRLPEPEIKAVELILKPTEGAIKALQTTEVAIEQSPVAAPVICRLCNLPLTVDDAVGQNIKTLMLNRLRFQVHKVCPTDPNAQGLPPGQVWLKEGSPGSRRYA